MKYETPSLPGPSRHPPAGLGHFLSQPVAVADTPLAAMQPDMERALGALRDFTRRDILLRFYTDRKARSVDDVARAVGVHRSVAFDHLERLVALGYLEIERRRGLPGKPAKIYRLTAEPLQLSHPARRYDVLAEGLARAIDEADPDHTVETMKAAGRSFGLSHARPGVTSIPSSLEPLQEMGGGYELGPGGRLDCTNCLFAEVCRRAAGICDFHAGLIEGLSARDGRTAAVQPLGHQGPGGCAFLVRQETLG